ncbi:MAG: DUF4349 domain-containing protein [Gemmataceae bacterium]|nr:DUF4349 domain-containing protein [Gemmataceae bacterium]
MRSILLVILFVLPLGVGCSKSAAPTAEKIGMPAAEKGMARDEGPQAPMPAEHDGLGGQVAFQEGQPPQGKGAKEAKVDQPRKVKYTADMKLIVEKLTEAEEALDAARKEAKAEYEKMEVNTSANTVRSGMWRVRVPVDNLNSFRKDVKKIGDVEKDTIESEDMTAKYYDLEAHLTNRKLERDGIREFIKEIGKKDQRYREVMRELEAISDDINRKEGTLKLWANLTDLTTFTIHMRERQKFIAETKVDDKPPPQTFSTRASTTWTASWDLFVGFLEAVAIVAIAIAPWLPIPLVLLLLLWVAVKILVRFTRTPEVIAVVVEATPATEKEK